MVKDSMLGAFQEHICSECNRCTGEARLQNINIRYEKACHIMDCPTLNAIVRAAEERQQRIDEGFKGTVLENETAEEQTAVATDENTKEEN